MNSSKKHDKVGPPNEELFNDLISDIKRNKGEGTLAFGSTPNSGLLINDQNPSIMQEGTLSYEEHSLVNLEEAPTIAMGQIPSGQTHMDQLWKSIQEEPEQGINFEIEEPCREFPMPEIFREEYEKEKIKRAQETYVPNVKKIKTSPLQLFLGIIITLLLIAGILYLIK